MKPLLLTLAVVLLVFGSFFALVPEAKCATCFTGECYSSSMCGTDCVCLKRGLDLSGFCYSKD